MGCQWQEYLDFVAGIAVCNWTLPSAGNCHCKGTARKLNACFQFIYTEPQAHWQIAGYNSFADKVFFAIVARKQRSGNKAGAKYAHENMGPDKFELITMKDSFMAGLWPQLRPPDRKIPIWIYAAS